MQEAELIAELWRQWPRGQITLNAGLLELAGEAVRQHPHSAELWWIAGSLNELAQLGGPPHALDPLECYRKAAALAPNDARSWVSIGTYLDVHFDDLAGAESAFRTALRLDPEADAYEGLVRVLAQQSRRPEALELLAQMPRGKRGRRRQLRAEIERGIWESPPPSP